MRNYAEPTNGTSNTNGTNGSHASSNGFANGTTHIRNPWSDYNNGSLLSAVTEHTDISSPGTTQAYIENCGSSIASNRSNDGGSSQVSLLNGASSNGSQSTIACYGPDDFDGYYSGIPSVLEFNGTRLIFQGEIGRVSWNRFAPFISLYNFFFFSLQGNYGCVFRGQMESFEYETPVAIKLFRTIESDAQFRDFLRETKIMETLKHENIVRIHGFREDPLLIIMEYMEGGSLLTYLSIHRPDLKVENLLDFAADIAKVKTLIL